MQINKKILKRLGGLAGLVIVFLMAGGVTTAIAQYRDNYHNRTPDRHQPNQNRRYPTNNGYYGNNGNYSNQGYYNNNRHRRHHRRYF